MSEKKSLPLVNADNFETEVLNEQSIVLVDFYSDTCGPCKAMEPIMLELASDESLPIKVCKLNVTHVQDIAVHYGVRSLPAFLYFKEGEVVLRSLGMATKAVFIDAITMLASDNKEELVAAALQGEFDNLVAKGDVNGLRQILKGHPELATKPMSTAGHPLPIGLCTRRGLHNCADLLVEFGAVYHPVDLILLGRTEEALDLFSKEPALLNTSDNAGTTPIAAAVTIRDMTLLDRLLEMGGDLSAANPDGGSIVRDVLMQVNVDLARKLVAKGAATEPDGYPLAALAARGCQRASSLPYARELLSFAVEFGHDTQAWRSEDGKSLADIVRECGKSELLEGLPLQ